VRELVATTLDDRLEPGSEIVEAGCGSGGLLEAIGPRFRCTGFDLDIDTARGRVPGVTLVEAGIEQVPFGDAAFDALVAIDVVSAAGVQDDRRALAECRRILRPGGIFVMQVAAYEWLRSGHDAAAGTGRRYSARRLQQMLEEAGFDARVGYRVTLLFPPAALHRIANRRISKNDVGPVPRPLNSVLLSVMRFENRLVSRMRLPFGLSVFALATAV